MTGPSAEEVVRENSVKAALTHHLRKAVQTLQKQHVNSDKPIHSEDTTNSVCNVLEAIFLHGLKPSISKKLSGFLGGTQEPSEMNFWDFVTKFSHRDVVAQLNHLGQITTQIGMCRAWIRLALNDSLLESYLTAILRDNRTLHTYYRRTAYLRDSEQPSVMLTYIQGLCEFRFELSYNSSVLNMWTTTPLVLAGLLTVQAITPQPVISPTTAEEVFPDQSPPGVAAVGAPGRKGNGSSSKTRLVTAIGYTDSTLAQALSTPPNTPYDPSHIPPSEMEHIRRMIEAKHSGSDTSTATSQVSHPDSTDQRLFPQLCVSPRRSAMGEEYLASGVDSGLGGEYASNDSVLAVPGVVRSKVRTKPTRKKKVKKKRHREIQNEAVEKPINVDNLQNMPPASAIIENDDVEMCNSILPNDLKESTSTALFNDIDTAQEEPAPRCADSPVPISAAVCSSDVTIVNTQSSTSTLLPGDASQTHSTDTIATESKQCDVNSTQPVAIETDKNEGEIHSIYSNIAINQLQEGEAPVQSKVVPSLRFLSQRQKSMSPPELSIITATANGVEEAREADRDESQSCDNDTDDIQIFDGADVSVVTAIDHPRMDAPRGNSLGQTLLQGWSSEFEDQSNLYDTYRDGHQSDDYVPTLLGGMRPNYMPSAQRRRAAYERTMGSQSEQTESPGRDSTQGAGSFEDFEILTDDEHDMQMEEARLHAFKELMTEIQHEKGLDFHNFQCKGCKRPVGLFFCNPRVCAYDGGYYCYECHENNEYYIPAKILHNWDFQKYPVSQSNLVLLKQFEDTPLVNVNAVNPRLYDHVKDVQEVKLLRTQLRFLKAYLFTCKQSVADEFRQQVMPKEYLYDDIHLYALLDLLQIPSGQLAACLRKLIKFASRHVYDCGLCSGKGFICEICDNPKVIYPFEMDSTYRCDSCEAVYHKACKTPLVQCPKCRRKLDRQIKLGELASSADNDYACSMQL